MVVKADQERVKTLISDTITLLCRNGLSFKTKFNINALIGITLDEDDVFLLDIRETIKNNVPELEDVDTLENSSVNQGPVSPSRRRKKRKRSHSNRESNGDQANSDSEGESVTKRLVKAEQEEEDSDDELVFIKDEPADESLQGSMYGGASNMYQNSQQHQQEQSGDILSSLAQQGQLYAMPTGSDGQPSGPSQWDPTTSQVPFSQAGQATPAGSQLNMSMGDSPAQSRALKLTCTICGLKAFSKRTALAEHHNEQHMEHSHMCHVCLLLCPDKETLMLHQEGHGEPCNQCGKRFSSQGALTQHLLNIHNGVPRYRCPLCQKGCSSSEQFRGHMASQHKRAEFLVACPVCKKTFSRRSKMVQHVKRFHPDDTELISQVQQPPISESLEPLLAALDSLSPPTNSTNDEEENCSTLETATFDTSS